MACNVAVLCGLHQILDNEFFYVIVQKLTPRLDTLNFSQLKNLTQVVSLLYLFDSVTLGFLISYVHCLVEQQQSLECLQLLFQLAGSKVRHDSPKLLKDLIDFIVSSLGQQEGKDKYLLDTLQDIRMNRKIKGDPAERLLFLLNFVKKSVV